MRNTLIFIVLNIFFANFLSAKNVDSSFKLDSVPRFNWPAPPGDSCESAPFLCGNFLDGYRSKTDSLTASMYLIEQGSQCFSIENDAWLRISPCSDSLVLSIKVDNCKNNKGLEVALLSGMCNDSMILAGSGTCIPLSANDSTVFLTTQLQAGKTYWLLIDGQDGDQCDFKINVIDGIGTAVYDSSTCTCDTVQVKGPTEICLSDTLLVFSVNTPNCSITPGVISGGNGAICYPDIFTCQSTPDSLVVRWHIPKTMYFVGDSTGLTVQLGVYPAIFQLDTLIKDSIWVSFEYVQRVPVDTSIFCSCNGCSCGYVILPLFITIKNEVKKIVLPWTCRDTAITIQGQTYKSPGTYLFRDSCTTFIHEIVFQKDTQQLTEIIILTCKNPCFQRNNAQYCEPGNYFDEDSCTVYFFIVRKDNVQPGISGLVRYCLPSNTAYEVQFDLTGTGPFRVNGDSLPGTRFVSQPIPSGQSYTFLVKSATTGCDTILTGEWDCDLLFGQVYLPNAFSPDGDGTNDTYRAFQVGTTQIVSLEVYNRWGVKMFQGKDTENGWDGRFNGRDCPADVYVVFLRWLDSEGEKTLKGDVTLIR